MLYEIDQQIEELMEKYINEKCAVGDRERTGLDPRAFYTFWYNNDVIIVPAGSRRTLDYYGGFEYIDSDYVKQYGDYVVYSSEADRVQEVIESLNEEMENA